MAKKNKHIISKGTKNWINKRLSKHMRAWEFRIDCRDAMKDILTDICTIHTAYLMRKLTYKDRWDIEHCWNNINSYIWTKLEREAKRRIKGQFR